MKSRQKFFLTIIFCWALATNLFSQRLSVDAGFQFNNDFTLYYKDLKPFYYSGIPVDLLWKQKRAEYMLGFRYMPYLRCIRPELGFNYYLHPHENARYNYFFHTTFFFNNYLYNTISGYENYGYAFTGTKPLDYNTVSFITYMQDVGIGFKIGLSHKLSWMMIFGGGYFYSLNDYTEGANFKNILKDKYQGLYYSVRFSLKYLLFEKKEKDLDDN